MRINGIQHALDRYWEIARGAIEKENCYSLISSILFHFLSLGLDFLVLSLRPKVMKKCFLFWSACKVGNP